MKRIKVLGVLAVICMLMFISETETVASGGVIVCPGSGVTCKVTVNNVTIESEKDKDRGAIEMN